MNAKPTSPGVGYERLAARLDIPNSDFFPSITIQQANSLKAKYWIVQNFQHAVKLRVKAYLSDTGVGVATILGYYGFANEVMKALGAHGHGATARLVVHTLISKYTGMGLMQSVCEGIRDSVFNIEAPAGP